MDPRPASSEQGVSGSPAAPSGDGRDAAALRARVAQLKVERNAVVLAHNYQLGEIQEAADHIGDSLELSRIAAHSAADVIVFCGVHFMAETAAILAPEKTVLLPVLDADCPMARMAGADELRRMKARHPGARVVCYVNTTAEVKAECDICCTSANAVAIVSRMPPEDEIIFVPDSNLGRYVESRAGRRLHLWPGRCPAHARLRAEDVLEKRRQFPGAEVIVHPESPPEVTQLADAVLSTGGMVRRARESRAPVIVVGTEIGLLFRLRRENPDKRFVPLSEQAVCPDMKRIALEDLVASLEHLQHRVTVPADTRRAAERAVARMIEVDA